MIYDTPPRTQAIVGLNSYKYLQPSTYTPTISQKDYDEGYINRFFVGRINYFEVIETNYKDYNMTDSSYFTKVKINWKITGVEFDVYNGKLLEAVGVVNYNRYRIIEAQRVIPNIDRILNNPKQFWRGY
jgi:hypothetical protein